jgi:uncharacterized protein (TIGR00251 family)
LSSAPQPFYRWRGADLHLACHLQPGASRSGFAGLHGDRLKIRIAAPPVDGKANAALIAFLAAEFSVPKQQVAIERGDSSRQKSVCIERPQRLPDGLGIAPQPPSHLVI